jgi:hypothetical protein
VLLYNHEENRDVSPVADIFSASISLNLIGGKSRRKETTGKTKT